VTDYGFNICATKEIALCRDEPAAIGKIFSSVMIIKLALAFLSLLILASIVYCVPRFRNDATVYMLSAVAIAGNALFPVWFFQGMEKMKHITSLNIFGGIVSALLIFSLVQLPQDYLLVPLINSSVVLLTGLLGQYIVFQSFRVSFTMQKYEDIACQLKAGWDVFISLAAITAYTNTRVFLLGLLTNNTVTGFYSIADKIANACQTFPLDSFTRALFPRLSHIYHRNKIKAQEIMQRIQHITTIISLLCLPLIFLAADFIVRIACGGMYRETIIALRLLLIAVFFVAANAFRVQFLLVCGKTRLYSQIHVGMALVGLPVLFFSIFYFSYTGAAVATILIEAGIFVITYINAKKYIFP